MVTEFFSWWNSLLFFFFFFNRLQHYRETFKVNRIKLLKFERLTGNETFFFLGKIFGDRYFMTLNFRLLTVYHLLKLFVFSPIFVHSGNIVFSICHYPLFGGDNLVAFVLRILNFIQYIVAKWTTILNVQPFSQTDAMKVVIATRDLGTLHLLITNSANIIQHSKLLCLCFGQRIDFVNG